MAITKMSICSPAGEPVHPGGENVAPVWPPRASTAEWSARLSTEWRLDMDVKTTELNELTDAELDDINGGFLFLLVGAAAFSTGFFAGYGAVRFAQDVSK